VKKVEPKKKLLVEFELETKFENYKSKQENEKENLKYVCINQLTLFESSHTSLCV
jgi:hypothetical protein